MMVLVANGKGCCGLLRLYFEGVFRRATYGELMAGGVGRREESIEGGVT